jgi:hypothetical protein
MDLQRLTCLGNANDIRAGEHCWDGVCLNRSGDIVVHLLGYNLLQNRM